MAELVPIIKSNTTLTPYKFYSEFLSDAAAFYRSSGGTIGFKLFEKGDDDVYGSKYRIDPITIPLLLCMLEQLSKYHKTPLQVLLYNNVATVSALEFLQKCDFFYLAGNNINPNFPRGRNLISFDSKFIGLFSKRELRNEHRVRAYSLKDDDLGIKLDHYESEDQKRDFLISHYTYKVREHFEDLLFDNDFTADIYHIYIDILSELITNSVLHSGSNAYALMFVDRFNTKFSISDNGHGFSFSMQKKVSTFYYEPFEVKKELEGKIKISNISSEIHENLFTILETLYFSSLKDRQGLFDLMITVVLNSKGYFRIHNDNCQIVISNRMMDELEELQHLRMKISQTHNSFHLSVIDKSEWETILKEISQDMKAAFISFCEKAVVKYNDDIRYSSLRFFKVRFRGVHVEVEIPNSFSNDHFSNQDR